MEMMLWWRHGDRLVVEVLRSACSGVEIYNGGFMGLRVMCVSLSVWVLCVGMGLWVWVVCVVVDMGYGVEIGVWLWRRSMCGVDC